MHLFKKEDISSIVISFYKVILIYLQKQGRTFFFTLLGYFFIFLIPFFESSEKGNGFIFLLIASFIFIIQLGRKFTKPDKLEFIYIIFLLVTFIGIYFSWSVSRSFIEWVKYLCFYSVFCFIRRLSTGEKKFFIFIYILFLAFSSFYFSIINLFYQLSGNRPSSADILNFIYPLAGHNHLAGYLLISIPLISGLVIGYVKSWKLKLILYFILAILLFSFMVTYSRSAYLLMAFYLLCMGLYLTNLKKKMIKNVFIIIGLLVFIFFQFLYFYSFFPKNEYLLYKKLYKPITKQNLRGEYFHQSFEGFKKAPFFGTGLDTFIYVSHRFQTADYGYYTVDNPHNFILKMLTEAGFIGGACYLVFFAYFFIKIFNQVAKGRDLFQMSLFIALIITLLNNLIDYDIQFISILLNIFILISLLYPLKNDNSQRDQGKSIFLSFIGFIMIYFTLTYFSANLFVAKILPVLRIENINYIRFIPFIAPYNARLLEQISLFYESRLNFDKSDYFNSLSRKIDSYDINLLFHGARLKIRLNQYSDASNIYNDILFKMPEYRGTYKEVYVLNLFISLQKLKSASFTEAVKYVRNSEIIFPEAPKITHLMDNDAEILKNMGQIEGMIRDNILKADKFQISEKELTLIKSLYRDIDFNNK
jgi:O-antigen ligase